MQKLILIIIALILIINLTGCIGNAYPINGGDSNVDSGKNVGNDVADGDNIGESNNNNNDLSNVGTGDEDGSGNQSPQSKKSIILSFNSEQVIVDLYDNASTRDFMSILPLTIRFDDYNSSEKTANLPSGRRLDITGAPSGYDPSAGELGYYSPWGNMVIYHRDFTYASGIVPLGKFRFGEEKFTAIIGKVDVTFTVMVNK